MTSVTVYSTGPACKQCWATCEALKRSGIPVTLVDLSDSGSLEARKYVMSELGYSQAPVVVVDDDPGNHWSGFRPDLIQRLAAAQLSTAPTLGWPHTGTARSSSGEVRDGR